MYLMIDNYDSFVYNLAAYFEELNQDIKVIRNDAMSVEEIEKLKPSHIILSPGPGYPKDAGVCKEVVRKLQGKIPILGVCLGHQAVCAAFGAKITYAKKQMHGKQSQIKVDTETLLFSGCSQSILAARYHSLAVDEKTLPDVFEILARTEDGEIMAMQHKEYPLIGIQFHPESIYTDHGKKMIENFLKL